LRGARFGFSSAGAASSAFGAAGFFVRFGFSSAGAAASAFAAAGLRVRFGFSEAESSLGVSSVCVLLVSHSY
jgi:hypothetical protein